MCRFVPHVCILVQRVCKLVQRVCTVVQHVYGLYNRLKYTVGAGFTTWAA